MGRTFRITKEDNLKANRKGNREAELEMSIGFVSRHKVHKSIKDYSRQREKKYCFFED